MYVEKDKAKDKDPMNLKPRGCILRRRLINLNTGVIVSVSSFFEFWWRKNYF
jgi:hypothetical protein